SPVTSRHTLNPRISGAARRREVVPRDHRTCPFGQPRRAERCPRPRACRPRHPRTLSAVPADRLHRVAVLVLQGAKPLDVGIPAQVFTTRASLPYQGRVCGPAPGRATGGDGLSYDVAHGLEALAWAQTVFVPGYRFPDREDPPPSVVDALVAAYEAGT